MRARCRNLISGEAQLKNRSWASFHIFLVCGLLAGGPIGCGERSQSATEETQRVPDPAVLDAIEGLGGAVEIDDSTPTRRIVAVSLQRTNSGDNDLATIEGLAALEKFDISETNVTDAGLAICGR